MYNIFKIWHDAKETTPVEDTTLFLVDEKGYSGHGGFKNGHFFVPMGFYLDSDKITKFKYIAEYHNVMKLGLITEEQRREHMTLYDKVSRHETLTEEEGKKYLQYESLLH